MKRLLLPCVAIAAITFVAPQPASAASLIIDDTLPGDTILFSMNDFEGGFFLDGVLAQMGLGSPASVLVAELNSSGDPIVHTFSAGWITGGLVPVTALIAFAEAGVSPALGVSDILAYTYSVGPLGGHLEGAFVSDAEGSLLPFPPGATVVAGGVPFLFDNGNMTASMVSDLDVVAEPASLLLLGTGLLGAVACWRRRRVGRRGRARQFFGTRG